MPILFSSFVLPLTPSFQLVSRLLCLRLASAAPGFVLSRLRTKVLMMVVVFTLIIYLCLFVVGSCGLALAVFFGASGDWPFRRPFARRPADCRGPAWPSPPRPFAAASAVADWSTPAPSLACSEQMRPCLRSSLHFGQRAPASPDLILRLPFLGLNNS